MTGRGIPAIRPSDADAVSTLLLAVISFLLPVLVPAGVYGLELFIGLIQAFVFSMLLMVFASMAMHKHGGDDDHH